MYLKLGPCLFNLCSGVYYWFFHMLLLGNGKQTDTEESQRCGRSLKLAFTFCWQKTVLCRTPGESDTSLTDKIRIRIDGDNWHGWWWAVTGDVKMRSNAVTRIMKHNGHDQDSNCGVTRRLKGISTSFVAFTPTWGCTDILRVEYLPYEGTLSKGWPHFSAQGKLWQSFRMGRGK
jgi:hypothetical protein